MRESTILLFDLHCQAFSACAPAMPREEEEDEPQAAPQPEAASTGKKGKFRRDKPWDVDGIDHWCVPGALRESSGTRR